MEMREIMKEHEERAARKLRENKERPFVEVKEKTEFKEDVINHIKSPRR
jgi:hypothetical protein